MHRAANICAIYRILSLKYIPHTAALPAKFQPTLAHLERACSMSFFHTGRANLPGPSSICRSSLKTMSRRKPLARKRFFQISLQSQEALSENAKTTIRVLETISRMAATPSRTHETALPEKEFVTGWGENSAYVRYWAIEIY